MNISSTIEKIQDKFLIDLKNHNFNFLTFKSHDEFLCKNLECFIEKSNFNI